MSAHRRRIVTYFWLGFALVHCVRALPEVIRIGGLFGDEEEPTSEVALRYAIYRINQEKLLSRDTKIAYDIQHLPDHNSFLASKKACNQAGLGVAGIFGPKNHDIAGHINSMCNTLEIPHIEVRLEPHPDEFQLFSINLFPDTTMLSRAYMDLVKYFKWKNFCVLYGDQNDLLLLQDIIRAPLSSEVQITVRQATKANMRETLKDIDKNHGIHQVIAHLSADDTYWLLKSALQLGMIDPAHHFILTNLDIESINMDDFRHNYVNVTGLRIVNVQNPTTKDILNQMRTYEKHAGVKLLNQSQVIKSESALMYDAVYVLARALQDLDRSSPLRLVNLTCEGDQAWAFGSSLYNCLNMVEMDGLTGKIKFERGRRVDFSLDILQLQSTGLKNVGTWTSEEGINFTTTLEVSHQGGMFGNKTLLVTSILEDPYVMLKKSEYILNENDKYEGFCVDLLSEIAELVGFKYRFELVPDGRYGAPNENGEWNGMVRQLIDRKADLAVASLTISYLREQVIDFTKPFMNLGISILFKRPKRESPGLFSFLNPLAIEIWLYVIAAYFVVSILMFVLARFSPYEWYNPHPCNPDTDQVENNFTLSNSFWFAVGTLMQQGSDINPRAVSTRIVGGIWWFFTLIIISSYTANLAAFLTVERMVSPIESAEDLAKQTKISYGTISGGSTMTFFRESKIPTYQRMWAFMESKDDVFVSMSSEGIERVKNSDYAFLMESTMIDFTIQRNCDLMQVGGLLDSKGYGIGTPMGSPYRDPISMAILNLQENGRIQMLYNKWWKNTGTCNIDEKKQESKASSLGIANVGGIFVVLVAGLALAVISAFIEFMWNSRKNSNVDKCDGCRYNSGYEQSLWSEMVEELRFAVRCHGSTKKPALKRQCSKCMRMPTDSCAVDSPNGIIQLKDIHRRSPRPHQEPHFRYHDAQIDHYPPEFRDTPT